MENDVLYNRIMNQVLEEYGAPGERIRSISAVYTQGGTVYDTDSLDSLKTDLVVTATYNNSTTETVPGTDYTLSGTLEVGTSTITVSYSGKTTTFNVTVTQSANIPYNLNYLFADITLSDGYIGDGGSIVEAADNKFYDELIPAHGFWIICTNGDVYAGDNNTYWRLAEYDAQDVFIQRKAAQQGSHNSGLLPATADSGDYIKMGSNHWSVSVGSGADRFVACNLLDTRICTIPGMTIDATGAPVETTDPTAISDFLPVNAGYIICQLTRSIDTALVVFYDENKELISRNAVTSGLTNNMAILQVPPDAKYVRFRCGTTADYKVYVSYKI